MVVLIRDDVDSIGSPGEDELQLIDFSEEDDCLIAFPFRDYLEDLRLSGADYLFFDHLPLLTYDNLNDCNRIKLFESINSQVLERIDQAQSESMEPRRPSFLRKILAWDSAFFTGADRIRIHVSKRICPVIFTKQNHGQ
ncbi:hypothetical protein L2E82_45210 [Cichorium intybus]|uniref:Uncharacterized protein n=1 Tax=Cichorium intybus TaxID=13427 RepID=A0ACB8ZT76_CICIN|nr:hypothetical protein L2E82_45210 [Cichorium intybus]